jgi:hypothetical protein
MVISGITLAFTLAAKMGLALPNLERDAAAGYLPERIMIMKYSLYWLISLFSISVYLFYKMISVMGKEYYLSDAALQKAQDILNDYPEYVDILGPLMQEAIATDDGERLSKMIHKIREIIRLKEGLACKWMCVANLEDQIAKRETELRVKIE